MLPFICCVLEQGCLSQKCAALPPHGSLFQSQLAFHQFAGKNNPWLAPQPSGSPWPAPALLQFLPPEHNPGWQLPHFPHSMPSVMYQRMGSSPKIFSSIILRNGFWAPTQMSVLYNGKNPHYWRLSLEHEGSQQ